MGLVGMIAAGTVATSAVAVTAVCVPFVTPALRKICIPYVPATPQQLQNVATALSACPTKVSPLVDLGSGDGRVVSCFFFSFLMLNKKNSISFPALFTLLLMIIMLASYSCESRIRDILKAPNLGFKLIYYFFFHLHQYLLNILGLLKEISSDSSKSFSIIFFSFLVAKFVLS